MAIQKIREKFNIEGSFVQMPKEWPPHEHRARIANYEKFEKLFEGQHEEVFQAERDNDPVYVVANIAKNIVTTVADFLYGEELELSYPEDADEKKKERVEAMWKRNKMQTTLFEAALDTGVDGDGVFVVNRNDDGEAVFEPQVVTNWFPALDPDNCRTELAHMFAWERSANDPVSGANKKYLRAIIHEKGKITNRLAELQGGNKVGAEASDAVWAQLYGDDIPPKEVITKIDDFLVVHIPNFRTSRMYFGLGEYADCESLIEVIDDRLTQSNRVLSRNADPALALESGLYDYLKANSPTGRIDKALLDVVKAGPNGEVPGFVVWDGDIEGNLKFVEQLIKILAVVSETAPQLLSAQEWGGDLSGRALTILLIRTIAKVNRRRKYHGDAITKLLTLGQLIEGEKEPLEVGVIWPDGLPQDIIEAIEVVDRRLRNKTMSRKQGIQQLDDIDKDKAEERMDEIDEETQAELEQMVKTQAKANPNGGPGGRSPISVSLGAS